jgi:sarcosine oxidase subunit gamma
VSDAYTAIEVGGIEARAALMKVTTLDLHPRAFKARQVAGSLFGRANAWLWLDRESTANGPHFQLIVRASFADYLWCLLAAAGREWGMPEEAPASGETLLQATVQSLS